MSTNYPVTGGHGLRTCGGKAAPPGDESTKGQGGPAADAPARARAAGAGSRLTAPGILARALAALAATLTLALLVSTAAYGGEWVQVSCINPDQTAAPSSGWSTGSSSEVSSEADTQCSPGTYAFAQLSTAAPAPVGTYQTLRYSPPAGSTLEGGLLDLALTADGYGSEAWGAATAYAGERSASDVLLQCAAGHEPCYGATNSYIGVLEVPTGRGGDLYLEASCDGASARSCDEGGSNGAFSQVQLWWAELRLTNNALPAASAIGGTLLTGEDRGSRELQLQATERRGPGIYNVTVQADSQTLYSATPDSNDGECEPVGESDGALMFDASIPCRQQENIDIPIETALLHDGTHTLKVTVSDPAGNTAVVYDNTITTHNAPENTTPPTITTSQAPEPGGTLTSQPGQWQAPEHAGQLTYSYQWQDCNTTGGECAAIADAEAAGYTPTTSDSGHTLRVQVTAADNDGTMSLQSEATAVVTGPVSPPASITTGASALAAALGVAGPAGEPNGSPASPTVEIQLAGKTHIIRSFAERELTLTGQLATSAGTPITDALLQVSEQEADSTASHTIGQARTDSTGAFTINIPPGPSRTITISYRSASSNPAYTAQASIQETVTAGIQLHITPRHTTPTGTITLEGHVQGALPAGGLLVELQVHYRGQWVPFRTPRTSHNGHFKTRYQFQGGEGNFPFRAMIPAGQADYPYASGYSNTITVNSR